MMNSVTLIKRDIVSDAGVKSSLCESETDLVCRVGPSVADVDEFCHERKFMSMNFSICDDRRSQIGQGRHLICRRKILTIARPVDTHTNKYH
jgi:hypothetical protein